MNKSIDIKAPASVWSEAPHFAAHRFAAYFHLFSYANMRKNLLTLSAIFIITFILFIFNFYANALTLYKFNSFPPSFDACWSAECSIMTMVLLITAMIGGLRIFESVASRSGRIDTLQIPASQFEKFLTWLIIYLPILIFASFCCFYLADIARVVWIKSFTSYGDYAHIIPLDMLFALTTNLNGGSSTSFDIVFTYSSVIFLNSVFALGGILFSKHAGMKTLFALFIISTVLGLVSALGYHILCPDGISGVRTDPDIRDISTSWIYGCITVGFSVFIYAISYLRLKETELINRW